MGTVPPTTRSANATPPSGFGFPVGTRIHVDFRGTVRGDLDTDGLEFTGMRELPDEPHSVGRMSLSGRIVRATLVLAALVVPAALLF